MDGSSDIDLEGPLMSKREALEAAWRDLHIAATLWIPGGHDLGDEDKRKIVSAYQRISDVLGWRGSV